MSGCATCRSSIGRSLGRLGAWRPPWYLLWQPALLCALFAVALWVWHLPALYEAARALAAEAGWELGEGSTGGGSDGSFTAGMGVPTLDGIGPAGNGAHSVDEHVLVEDLPRRVALYGRLLETL